MSAAEVAEPRAKGPLDLLAGLQPTVEVVVGDGREVAQRGVDDGVPGLGRAGVRLDGLARVAGRVLRHEAAPSPAGLAGVEDAVAVSADAFFAVDFFAVVFLEGDFFAVEDDLFAVDFFAVDFFAGADVSVAFFAADVSVDFFAADFFAVAFFAGDESVAVFVADFLALDCFAARTRSSWSARGSGSTSRSAKASTSASVRRWPASKPRPLSGPC